MVNDRSHSSWSGTIVDGNKIRYHPETLRAALRRGHNSPPNLEDHIAKITHAAKVVSRPFCLNKGDLLLVSNHRALHYRGACSVVFVKFPTQFKARIIHVLHMNRELKVS